MNATTVNAKNRTIEMSNTFAKAPSLFGSEEYRQLQEARRDYPSYRVVTVKQKGTGKADFANLSFDFMDKYIANHNVSDDLKAEYLSTFKATKKWTIQIHNWGKIYGELSIMYARADCPTDTRKIQSCPG